MPLMEHKSILANIQDGESGTVEFKRTFDREAIETLAAFANSQGGSLFVGVSDSGDILGVDIGKETVQNWINQVKVATANTLVPDVEAAVLEEDCRHNVGPRIPHQARCLPGQIFQAGQ